MLFVPGTLLWVAQHNSFSTSLVSDLCIHEHLCGVLARAAPTAIVALQVAAGCWCYFVFFVHIDPWFPAWLQGSAEVHCSALVAGWSWLLASGVGFLAPVWEDPAWRRTRLAWLQEVIYGGLVRPLMLQCMIKCCY